MVCQRGVRTKKVSDYILSYEPALEIVSRNLAVTGRKPEWLSYMASLEHSGELVESEGLKGKLIDMMCFRGL